MGKKIRYTTLHWREGKGALRDSNREHGHINAIGHYTAVDCHCAVIVASQKIPVHRLYSSLCKVVRPPRPGNAPASSCLLAHAALQLFRPQWGVFS